MKKCILIPVLSYLFLVNGFGQKSLSDFLESNKPNNTPELYAPKIVSTNFPNRDFSISPNGNEVYFTLQNSQLKFSTILCSKKINNKWSTPEVASFSGVYSDLEPFISPDGTKLFFSSNRPIDPTKETKDYDLWVVNKTSNNTWGKAQHLGMVVNTKKDEFYPSVSLNGNLYFTATREDGQGKEDIFYSILINNEYTAPKPLPDSINTTKYEFNAYIAPDESFLIFSSYGREDGLGGGDLYYSTKDNNNQWLGAKNLGTKINSTFLDYCPFVDIKTKTLYFTSNRHDNKIPQPSKLSNKELTKMFEKVLNGLDNIYWLKLPRIIKDSIEKQE